jgi:hypothetical protein
MLKSTSETIGIPLAIIFNFSLQKGIFPSTWKIARVMPALKKDDKSRPSIMYQFLMVYLGEHD